MSKSSENQKRHEVYLDEATDAPNGGAKSSAEQPSNVVDRLLRVGESSETTGLDPVTKRHLAGVVRELGHLEFCADPVCEQLVTAVLKGDSESSRRSLPLEIVRMIAAALCEDITAKARLAAFWDKLKRSAT